MSDIPKYLPLSQRPRRDETAVTSNWSHQVAALLLQLAEIVDGLDDTQWEQVADATNTTLWLATTSRLQRLRVRVGPQLAREQAAQALRSAAVDAATGAARRGIQVLSAVVVGTWEVAATLGLSVEVDAVASGAVALARSLSAPTPIRAVVQVRTLVATDAGWRVGSGPELEGTAAGIVLFLFGRQGLYGRGDLGG